MNGFNEKQDFVTKTLSANLATYVRDPIRASYSYSYTCETIWPTDSIIYAARIYYSWFGHVRL